MGCERISRRWLKHKVKRIFLWLKRKDRQNNTSNSNLVAAKFVFYDGLRLVFLQFMLINSKRGWLYLRGDNSLLEMALRGRNKLKRKETKHIKKHLTYRH